MRRAYITTMAGSVIFPNDPAVLDHIEAYTAKVFEHLRGRGFPAALPPRREQINDLLALAFAASREYEEGRNVIFTLVGVEFNGSAEKPLTGARY
jgi:hypothetical protein